MAVNRIAPQHPRGEMAFLLVEVAVAALILAVLVFGTVSFIVGGRTAVARAGQQRVATQVAAERLELIRNAGYDAAANGSGSVTVGTTTYAWTTTVSATLADDSLAASGYKQVEVSVNWPTSGGIPVVLRTGLTP